MSKDFIGAFEKKQNEGTEAEQLEKEKRAVEPTTAEILADNENSVLFGDYLKQTGDVELGTLVETGKLGSEQMLTLSEKRRGFLDTKRKAETLRENLGNNIEQAIDKSPDFKAMADAVGVENLRRILAGKAIELSFRDPQFLENLTTVFNNDAVIQEGLSKNNEEIAAFCEKHKMTPEEYAEALNNQDGYSFALRDAIEDKMGFFKKMFTREETLESMAADLDKREVVREKIAARDANLKDLGDFLHKELFSDEKTHKTFIGKLIAEAPPADDGSFMEAKKSIREPGFNLKKIEGLRKQWESIKKDHEGDASFDVDAEYAAFTDGAAERHQAKKKGGWWQRIINRIWGNELRKQITK